MLCDLVRFHTRLNGNATATLPSESYAIAYFQPERVRDGFAKPLGRFSLLRKSPSRAIARDHPHSDKWRASLLRNEPADLLNRMRVVARSFLTLDGDGFAPATGRAVGCPKFSVRYAYSNFPLRLPHCPLRWGYEDFSLSLKPLRGRSRQSVSCLNRIFVTSA